ncbi:MAG: ethanolamine utilization protein EutJ, partial [Gorillibacterium sp.]|nr:ethanolamine utilization protein EutJ [Gorillibacterium sp.]
MKFTKLAAMTAILALAVTTVGCGKKPADDGTGPIKIGANFELSGGQASFGNS